MDIVSSCLRMEVTDVTGREVSLHTDRIKTLDQFLCVVNDFVVVCRNIEVPRKARTCRVPTTERFLDV